MAAETEPESVNEAEQLTLEVELPDEELDFGAWVESLPVEAEAA